MNTINIPNGVEATVAVYRDHKLPEYNDNPMIQALPHLMTEEEFLTSVTVMPNFAPEEKFLNPHLIKQCEERLST